MFKYCFILLAFIITTGILPNNSFAQMLDKAYFLSQIKESDLDDTFLDAAKKSVDIAIDLETKDTDKQISKEVVHSLIQAKLVSEVDRIIEYQLYPLFKASYQTPEFDKVMVFLKTPPGSKFVRVTAIGAVYMSVDDRKGAENYAKQTITTQERSIAEDFLASSSGQKLKGILPEIMQIGANASEEATDLIKKGIDAMLKSQNK